MFEEHFEHKITELTRAINALTHAIISSSAHLSAEDLAALDSVTQATADLAAKASAIDVSPRSTQVRP